MLVISDLDALVAKVAECNDVLVRDGDDAMRRFFGTFRAERVRRRLRREIAPEGSEKPAHRIVSVADEHVIALGHFGDQRVQIGDD